jgi:hypothetical protein
MSLINDSLIETLIEEIEKRPALFKKNLKEYTDINLKKRLWEEVCETVVPEWSELDDEEKRKQGKYIFILCIQIKTWAEGR